MSAKLGILGSSEGSNLVAVVEACKAGTLDADVVLVLSDVATAGILDKAKSYDLPTQFIPPGAYRTKLDDDAEQQFIEALRQAQVEWVVLAGFMRIIKSAFLRAFPERIVNIHPSLLPSFPGRNAPQQAIEHGVRVSGATVHLVDQGIDSGAIVAQHAVPVDVDDTAETLHARIKEAEAWLYPEAIQALVSGTIRIRGRETVREPARS